MIGSLMDQLLATPGLVWLTGGLLAFFAEVLLPGAFLLWIGIAAMLVGGVTWLLGIGFGAQVAQFAVTAPVSILLAQRRIRRVKRRDINLPENFLVGRSVTALGFASGEGRVRLGDSDWQARVAAGSPEPKQGALLRVVAVEGTVLVVKQAEA